MNGYTAASCYMYLLAEVKVTILAFYSIAGMDGLGIFSNCNKLLVINETKQQLLLQVKDFTQFTKNYLMQYTITKLL